MTFSIVIMVGRGYFLPTHVHEASKIIAVYGPCPPKRYDILWIYLKDVAYRSLHEGEIIFTKWKILLIDCCIVTNSYK